jgi:hypothetical protein
MKKVLFFTLLLMISGAASVNAQVRIGGDGAPHKAAILDLNESNDPEPAGNTGALALPRIGLADEGAALNGEVPSQGMMVYNTNASMTGGSGTGIYYRDAAKWVKLGSEAVFNVTAELDDDYTATAANDLILFTTTAGRRLTLPTTGIPVGKKLYISDMGPYGVSLYPNTALRDTNNSVVWSGFPVTIVYTGNGKWQVLNVLM